MDAMMDQHEDPKFERWLKDAARGYNAPPATPRDKMWQRIQNARASKPVIVLRPWMGWAVAAAALLALGIGIGRWSMNRLSPSGPSTPVAHRAVEQEIDSLANQA